jgi:hypothetical protein
MESKGGDKSSIQLMRLIVTGKGCAARSANNILSKNNMASCRRIYSVANVGVARQKIPDVQAGEC